jgi:hypothetical protein
MDPEITRRGMMKALVVDAATGLWARLQQQRRLLNASLPLSLRCDHSGCRHSRPRWRLSRPTIKASSRLFLKKWTCTSRHTTILRAGLPECMLHPDAKTGRYCRQ